MSNTPDEQHTYEELYSASKIRFDTEDPNLGFFLVDHLTPLHSLEMPAGQLIGPYRSVRCAAHVINDITRVFLFGEQNDLLQMKIQSARTLDVKIKIWSQRGLLGRIIILMLWIEDGGMGRIQQFNEVLGLGIGTALSPQSIAQNNRSFRYV